MLRLRLYKCQSEKQYQVNVLYCNFGFPVILIKSPTMIPTKGIGVFLKIRQLKYIGTQWQMQKYFYHGNGSVDKAFMHLRHRCRKLIIHSFHFILSKKLSMSSVHLR